MACDLRQCRRQFARFESEGTGLALVRDSSISVDQVNSVGPTGVGLFGGITEFIQHGREFDSQLSNACSCHKGPFVLIFGAREDNLVANIALHLPHVAGVRLGDVDHEERDFPLVLVVELVESGNLPPEWRSSVAAKNHDHRLGLV